MIQIALNNSKGVRSLGGVLPIFDDLGSDVLISRINTDISRSELEGTVQKLVSDIEASYWQLWTAHSHLQTAMKGRDAAQETWHKLWHDDYKKRS